MSDSAVLEELDKVISEVNKAITSGDPTTLPLFGMSVVLGSIRERVEFQKAVNEALSKYQQMWVDSGKYVERLEQLVVKLTEALYEYCDHSNPDCHYHINKCYCGYDDLVPYLDGLLTDGLIKEMPSRHGAPDIDGELIREIARKINGRQGTDNKDIP